MIIRFLVVALFLFPLVLFAEPQSESPAQKQTVTLNGVTFDSDYDNGSMGEVSALGPDHFRVELHQEQSSEGRGRTRYWFRFKISGAAGRTLVLEIYHKASPRPWLRVDGGKWRQTTLLEAPSTDSLRLEIPEDSEVVEVSFFEPIGFQEHLDWTRGIINYSPHARMETIGFTHQGRPIHMVTITDDGFPLASKRRVWAHARVHAGEVTSSHTMIGWLQQMTEDSPLGEALRQNFIVHLVPMVNADGVYLGHTRWDALGRDPERQWCEPMTHEGALALKSQVDEFMESGAPIEVMLNLHSTQGNFSGTFFFEHVRPSVTQEIEEMQDRYLEALDFATPLFDRLELEERQLAECHFIESYFWNCWPGQTMAITHEGHFRRRITDWEWITGEDYREIGRAQARALFHYFSIEPPVNIAK